MGISGLLNTLKSVTYTAHLEQFSGMTAAVDTYCWLHKGVYCCSTELCINGSSDKFVKYCLDRISLLQRHNITPLMVFDGGFLPMKAGKEDERKQRRDASMAKGLELYAAGNNAAADQHFNKAVDVSSTMANQLIVALKERGIKFVVAPYEADAQLAFLNRNGLCDLVISEDSDCIPFGCKLVLFKLDRTGTGQVVDTRKLPANQDLSLVHFTEDMFLSMCILSGCDYLPSIPGMGLKRAHRYVLRFKKPDKILRGIRFEGSLVVPPGYESKFHEARMTFRHQRVYCPLQRRIVNLNPLPNDLAENVTAEPDKYSFLGDLLHDEVAIKIAEGVYDPFTKAPYEQPTHQANSTATPPGIAHATTRQLNPAPTRQPHSTPKQRTPPPMSHTLLKFLPKQQTPSQKTLKRPFKSPIQSTGAFGRFAQGASNQQESPAGQASVSTSRVSPLLTKLGSTSTFKRGRLARTPTPWDRKLSHNESVGPVVASRHFVGGTRLRKVDSGDGVEVETSSVEVESSGVDMSSSNAAEIASSNTDIASSNAADIASSNADIASSNADIASSNADIASSNPEAAQITDDRWRCDDHEPPIAAAKSVDDKLAKSTLQRVAAQSPITDVGFRHCKEGASGEEDSRVSDPLEDAFKMWGPSRVTSKPTRRAVSSPPKSSRRPSLQGVVKTTAIFTSASSSFGSFGDFAFSGSLETSVVSSRKKIRFTEAASSPVQNKHKKAVTTFYAACTP